MKCIYCDEKIETGQIYTVATKGLLQGYAHKKCYYIHNPYKPKETFLEVLNNSEDQVLAKRIIDWNVDWRTKCRIVEEFNTAMQEQHDRIAKGVD